MKAIQVKSTGDVEVLEYVTTEQGAGIVESVGEDVKDIHPGDHVAYLGPCYAEFTIAPSKHVAKIPDGLDLKLAAASVLQ
ncbi:11521_t:CDS:2, partial [Racocetra fulgida]